MKFTVVQYKSGYVAFVWEKESEEGGKRFTIEPYSCCCWALIFFCGVHSVRVHTHTFLLAEMGGRPEGTIWGSATYPPSVDTVALLLLHSMVVLHKYIPYWGLNTQPQVLCFRTGSRFHTLCSLFRKLTVTCTPTPQQTLAGSHMTAPKAFPHFLGPIYIFFHVWNTLGP